MKRLINILIALCLYPLMSSAQTSSYDNSTIEKFDLSRYLGTWYEIARFDHSFERDMQNVTAEYLMRDDGKVDVINAGWKDGKYIRGKKRNVTIG